MANRTFEQLEQQFQGLYKKKPFVRLPKDSNKWRQLFNSKMLDNLPVGLAMYDKNFNLRKTNRTYADYLDAYSPYKAKKALHSNYFDFMPGSESQIGDMFRETRDQKITGTFQDYELWVRLDTVNQPTYWNANITPALDKKGNSVGIILCCLDVTQKLVALKKARKTEKELLQLINKFNGLKSTLKVMLDLKKEMQAELEERFTGNVHDIVLPLITSLRRDRSRHRNNEILNLIETTLFDMTFSFATKLNAPAFRLTPKEKLIASLIQAGKTTKEISSILTISPASISFHRANLRKKMGLTGQKVNLHSFLSSL